MPGYHTAVFSTRLLILTTSSADLSVLSLLKWRKHTSFCATLRMLHLCKIAERKHKHTSLMSLTRSWFTLHRAWLNELIRLQDSTDAYDRCADCPTELLECDAVIRVRSGSKAGRLICRPCAVLHITTGKYELVSDSKFNSRVYPSALTPSLRLSMHSHERYWSFHLLPRSTMVRFPATLDKPCEHS